MTRTKGEMPPVHPGEILLEEFLKPLGMTMRELAPALRVPANPISQIVEGKRSFSADTTLRLGRYFGAGPELCVNLQARYDLESAKDELGPVIDREVSPRTAA